MLTKKNLKRGLNIALLAITVACMAASVLMERLTATEKVVAVGGFLAALRAVLPSIKNQAEDAIDQSNLPSDEKTDVSAPVDAKYVQAAPLPSSTPTPVTVELRPKP